MASCAVVRGYFVELMSVLCPITGSTPLDIFIDSYRGNHFPSPVEWRRLYGPVLYRLGRIVGYGEIGLETAFRLKAQV